MRMKTSIILQDALVARAAKLTGIREKTALVHAGLAALIERKSAERLAILDATQPRPRPIRRRR
jgi:Arc/MetJ family transcription regulator